jgi:acyl carrier protein
VNRELLHRIVAEALEMPPEALPLDASSETVEAWDSLKHLDIVLAVESATQVKFDTAEIAELTSLDRLEAALQRRGWQP